MENALPLLLLTGLALNNNCGFGCFPNRCGFGDFGGFCGNGFFPGCGGFSGFGLGGWGAGPCCRPVGCYFRPHCCGRNFW